MRRCYTGTQVQAAERPRLEGGEGPALVRQAAWGLAHHTLASLSHRGQTYGARVIGLIGKGNNGGDTLWALHFLARRGVAVGATLINAAPSAVHRQGLAAFSQAGGTLVTTIPEDTAVVIDGVFGTGFAGTFDLPAYLQEQDLNLPTTDDIIACDIASGVVADTGDIPGASLQADMTVTFGGLKLGLLAGDGGQHAGVLKVVDIGLGVGLEAVGGPRFIDEVAAQTQVFA